MKSSNILLSDELRAKVNARVQECLDISAEKYGRTFEFPEIRYDVKNTNGGMAYHHKWLIRLNLILLVENEEDFIKQIVPHEVAHLINRAVNTSAEGKKLMPHGKEWKKVMALFGIPAKTCHTYDCTSIEKKPRVKRGSYKDSRVHRILGLIQKLSQEDRDHLMDRIDNTFF